MIDYEFELEEMTANKNLTNSYKLYFLKAILVNVSTSRREFSFYEMACWMCAYSFSDVCSLRHRICPLDKLFDTAVALIESEDLMEASKASEVYDAAFNTKNCKVRRKIRNLCNFVPYRLLAYLWTFELKGKTDRQKNDIIEQLSQSEDRCIYALFSNSNGNKYIEVNPAWASYIAAERKRLIPWIDSKIDSFVWKG